MGAMTTLSYKELTRVLLGSIIILCFTTAATGQLIGADIHFHLDLARIWAQGENGMMSSRAIDINKMPYPPLFHWLLVPGVWLGMERVWGLILQAVFYPLALWLTLNLMKDEAGYSKALMSGLLLVGSLAFYDRVIQAQPQALDASLYLLALYGLIKGNHSIFVIGCSCLVLNHGVVGLALCGGLLIRGFSLKRKKVVFLSLLIILIILFPSIPYFLSGMVRMGGPSTNAQEVALRSSPLIWGSYYLGGALLGLPALIQTSRKWGALKEHQKSCLLTVISLALMIPFWPERFLSYAALPLILLAASELPIDRLVWVSPFLVLHTVNPWLWLASSGFHVI